MLVSQRGRPRQEHFKPLSMMHISKPATPMAKVVMARGGPEMKAEAQGSGPVDATFKAIESIVA
jgi:2-isopropylmalate synthase